ncbi:MAG: AAA family ATPase [Desulfobacteraceae bacterium]|jgi:general secretion pathway protein A
MYESFFGLKEKPFNLLPDPDYLYMSSGHENIFTHLEYAIGENKGFVVITGEVGSGKTTLINYLISKSLMGVEVGLINNTYIAPNQVIKSICREFELDTDGLDRDEMLDRFHEFLIDNYSKNKRVILIFDEAQNLSIKTLEEIRMLSNLEAEKHHLIQIILSGQPELRAKLQDKRLKQFVQRITVYCHLSGLSRAEVHKYIKFRLTIGGAKVPDIFVDSAIGLIATYSKGIPRVINLVCDAALVYGYADNKKEITKEIIEEVIRERNDGGILTEKNDSEQIDHPIVADPPEVQEGAALRIEALEARIQNLETMFKSVDKRLHSLMNIRDEKDVVVLELFKMLKTSMESRYESLMTIALNQNNGMNEN